MADTPPFARPRTPPAQAAGRPNVRRRVVFYLILFVLDALAMQREVFTLALWMLVAPALVLVAVHWLALYLPLIDWPMTAWRRTRSPAWTVAWLAASLVLPVGSPLLFNAHQQRLEREARAADLWPAAPLPAPRTLLISAKTCDAWCQDLFAQGLVDHVLLASVASASPELPPQPWPAGASSHERAPVKAVLVRAVQGPCRPWDRLPGREGWCLAQSSIDRPRYDAVARFEPVDERPARNRPPGQIAVWSCPDVCVLVAQRTGLARDRLAVPLTVDYVDDTSLTVDPRFHRRPVAGPDLDPARTLAALFGLPLAGAPREGRPPADLGDGMPAYETVAPQAQADWRAYAEGARRDSEADKLEHERREALLARLEAQREARRQCHIAANRSRTDDLLPDACHAMPP